MHRSTTQVIAWLLPCARIDRCPLVLHAVHHGESRVNIKILILAGAKSSMRVWTMKIVSAKLVCQYLE